MKNEIKYLKGDATAPVSMGNKIIVHVCNDIGGWGKGFVEAISKRWKEPEQAYRNWYKTQKGFHLGAVQFVQVSDSIWIANLIGQHKIRKDEKGNPPIRYEAIREGMKLIKEKSVELNASIHMPRIGCGLAGGKWENIEPILKEELVKENLKVIVYDFN